MPVCNRWALPARSVAQIQFGATAKGRTWYCEYELGVPDMLAVMNHYPENGISKKQFTDYKLRPGKAQGPEYQRWSCNSAAESQNQIPVGKLKLDAAGVAGKRYRPSLNVTPLQRGTALRAC
jgi:hypothetical protein